VEIKIAGFCESTSTITKFEVRRLIKAPARPTTRPKTMRGRECLKISQTMGKRDAPSAERIPSVPAAICLSETECGRYCPLCHSRSSGPGMPCC
jgi:hypothetical protein